MKKLDPDERRRLALPAYSVSDVARYVHVPVATLRSWTQGRTYPVAGATRRSSAIIVPPTARGAEPGLSFVNLIEAYVLGAIRRKYRISLQKVRRAIQNLTRLGEREHPLAHKEFKTNGIGLFVEHYGGTIEISRDLQLQMKEVLSTYLQRIDYEANGSPPAFVPVLYSASGGERACHGFAIDRHQPAQRVREADDCGDGYRHLCDRGLLSGGRPPGRDRGELRTVARGDRCSDPLGVLLHTTRRMNRFSSWTKIVLADSHGSTGKDRVPAATPA